MSGGDEYARGFRAARAAASKVVVDYTDGDSRLDSTIAAMADRIDRMAPHALAQNQSCTKPGAALADALAKIPPDQRARRIQAQALFVLDAWDDGRANPPGSRCYVEGTFAEALEGLRTVIEDEPECVHQSNRESPNTPRGWAEFSQWFDALDVAHYDKSPDARDAAWMGWCASRERIQVCNHADLIKAVRALVFVARTSGGTAGRDEPLCTMLDVVESLLPPMVGIDAGGDEFVADNERAPADE